MPHTVERLIGQIVVFWTKQCYECYKYQCSGRSSWNCPLHKTLVITQVIWLNEAIWEKQILLDQVWKKIIKVLEKKLVCYTLQLFEEIHTYIQHFLAALFCVL